LPAQVVVALEPLEGLPEVAYASRCPLGVVEAVDFSVAEATPGEVRALVVRGEQRRREMEEERKGAEEVTLCFRNREEHLGCCPSLSSPPASR
jgi:hypothetical protein